MEENNHITWDKLIAEGRYLRSIGAPVDDKEQLAEWIRTHRQILMMPDEEVQSIVQRAVQNAIRQIEEEGTPTLRDSRTVSDTLPPLEPMATFDGTAARSGQIPSFRRRLDKGVASLSLALSSAAGEAQPRQISLVGEFGEDDRDRYIPWIGDTLEIHQECPDPQKGGVAYFGKVTPRADVEQRGVLHLVLVSDAGQRGEARLTPEQPQDYFSGSDLPADFGSLTLEGYIEGGPDE